MADLLKVRYRVCLIFLLLCLLFTQDAMSALAPSYETLGEAPAKNGDFVRARRIAVHRALRHSMENALKDLLGESAYNSKRKSLSRLERKPERFVKSYRFLEAVDDEEENISRVRLEVVLFTEALNKELNSVGLLATVMKKKAIVILIRERSFTTRNAENFWEYVPISEVALGKQLVAGNMEVVDRGSIFGVIPESLVTRAAKGDLTAGVNIGLKAGVDIVIVGNAVSTRLGKAAAGPIPVRASLNIKVLSALKSNVIAAKTEFATAEALDPLNAELQAFENVSEKMGTFLIDAIRRSWQPSRVAGKSPASNKGFAKNSNDPSGVSPKPGSSSDDKPVPSLKKPVAPVLDDL